jgi:hypothetical protein
VKSFAAEADDLVESVQLPARGAPTAREGPAAASRPRWTSGGWRAFAWAASVMLAVGLGWMASDFRVGSRAAPYRGAALDTSRGPAPAQLLDTEVPPAAAKAAPRPSSPAPPEPKSLDENAIGARVEQDRLSADQPRQDAERRVAAPTLRDAGEPVAKLAVTATADSAARIDGFGNAAVTAPLAAAPASPAEVVAQATGAFRQVQMEEAVRTLSGSIRLIDGLEPQRIMVAPGTAVAGADPSVPLVRVVYEDPPGRELWLDQQRPGEGRAQAAAANALGLIVGDTVLSRAKEGPGRVQWIDELRFRLVLTGFLPADSLRSLVGNVH